MEKISLESIDSNKRETAQQIVKRFSDAGFGVFQQAAAVSDAIIESDLNPLATSHDAVGLFQLNQHGGFGAGYTSEQLKDPEININIMVTAAKKVPEFVNATSLEEAVSAFVRSIQRPLDPDLAISRLRSQALRLLAS